MSKHAYKLHVTHILSENDHLDFFTKCFVNQLLIFSIITHLGEFFIDKIFYFAILIYVYTTSFIGDTITPK